MKRYVFNRGWTAVLAVAALLLMGSGAAHGRSMVIDRFDVELEVMPSGDLMVTETISVHFMGAWNGLIRDIPVRYRTPQGMNYTLFLNLIDIKDAEGNELTYKESRDRHYKSLKIWVPGAKDAVRTIVLRYGVRNGLRYFEEHDELYWNITGDEWDVPIREATAKIGLPDKVTGVRAMAFTGAYGSRERDAEVKIEGTTVTLTMKRELGFREGLTAVVGWDKGFVEEPGFLKRAGFFLVSNWPLMIPGGVFAVMLTLWMVKGKDPSRQTVMVQYEPPEGLIPVEVGTLVDNKPHMRDITASMVDLAVRGYIRIKDRTRDLSPNEYEFILLKPEAEWDSLLPFEQHLLGGIFSNGVRKEVSLTDLEDRFYTHLPKLYGLAFSRLMSRHYYISRPDKVRSLYVIIGSLVGVAVVVALWVFMLRGPILWEWVVSGLLSSASIIGFGWLMPARTIKGMRMFEEVLGLEEFLSRVETDRFARVVKTPEMFEKMLPYAMTLGVEKTWARAFEKIFTKPPNWYEGGGQVDFNPNLLVYRLNSMSYLAGKVMTTAPRSTAGSGMRSSGGSGFGGGGGGGGFSGGGFGGGGGRGF